MSLKPRLQDVVSYQHAAGKIRHKYVHRLVAAVWIDNPDDLPEVNHKDGDRTNCAASNLEWTTPNENIKHAMKAGLFWNYPRAGQQGFQRA